MFPEVGAQACASSGGGIKFLEYLASDKAQRYFADGNNEWPAVEQVKVVNPALDALGSSRPMRCRSGTWPCTRSRPR
jgi:ABC-type Fe3+ transport system substrate-binding protein